MEFRLSKEEDVAQLKELWRLGFGDEGPYVENFFRQYHKPSLMYVGEEGGELVGMTAIFDTVLHRGGKEHSFAYLYAVTTRPDQEKKGIAGGLLSFLYGDLKKRGFEGVTTVPATVSLHSFFGKQGFEEYFVHDLLPLEEVGEMERISALDYGKGRAERLENCDYITLKAEGYEYQGSVSALGRGGFFATKDGLFVAEEGSENRVIVKECFGPCPSSVEGLEVMEGRGVANSSQPTAFGMIQWFDLPLDWSKEERGYLGLAFD